MFSRALAILSILLTFMSADAQNFHLKNFRVEDGLPSSQVLDIKQDSKGNLWLATDLGVTRYNGYHFLTYTSKEGLQDNFISDLHIDKEDRVWCLGQNQSISLIENDSAYQYLYSDTLRQIIGMDFIRSIRSDASNTLYLGIAQECDKPSYSIQVGANGEINKSNYNENYYYRADLDGFIAGNSCPGEASTLVIENSGTSKTYDISFSMGHLSTVASNEQTSYAITHSNAVDLATGELYRLPSTSTGSALIDRDNNLWVSTYSGAVFYRNSRTQRTKIQILKNLSVNRIFQDFDGSVWIATSSKGLYLIKSLDIVVLDELFGLEEPNINSLTGNGNEVFFSDSRNNLYRTNGSGEPSLLGRSSNQVKDVIVEKGQPVFLENQKRGEKDFTFFTNGLSLFSNNDTVWVGKIYNYAAYVGDQEVFNSRSVDFSQRVNSIYSGRGKLYLGTLNGLYSGPYNNPTLETKTQGLRIERVSLKGEDVVISSKGNGLGILTGQNIKWWNEKNGLISNFVNDHFVWQDEIWVATNNGLSLLKNNEVRSIKRSDGLPSAEINRVWANETHVFVATRKGLSILDRKFLDRQKRQLVVVVSARGFSGTSEVELSYDQSSLTIDVTSASFRIDNPVLYRYKIENDSGWNYTQQPYVRYASLPSGSWTFTCSAQNESGEWGAENTSLKIIVDSPFYLKWWFILLVLFAVSIVVWLITQWRNKQNQKSEMTKNELNVLKIKALSSQMNPHFIFNSLNSIQTFLIDNDLRMSNKYLSKFARLMRLILNNSNETFVSLKEVLSTLELYMELEQLRFNHKFDYRINIDPRLEVDGIRVPSMLLQPFVENAILHGILPKEEKGLITLELKWHDEMSIDVKIVDDGVGREFHKDKIGKKHKSHGLRITRERLKVFESLLGNKFNLHIRDLKDENGKPKGTSVELLLPCR